MLNLTANFAEIAVLGVGMTLLTAWITYVKTARLKASLLDLAQDDARTIVASSEMESASRDALGSVEAEDAGQG
jgi:hypothetical protein